MECKRFVVPNRVNQVLAIEKAIGFAKKMSKESGKDIVFLVPNKKNVRYSNIGEALGLENAQRLVKNDYLLLGNDQKLVLHSQATFKSYMMGDVIILGILPTKKMLDEIDGATSAYAVIIVPYLDDEVSEWISTWNPKMLGEERESTISENSIDPIVSVALKALTSQVNLSSGLTHTLDRHSAIDLFKILKKENIYFDPNEVKIWAKQNGWTVDGANDLYKIAKDISEGKRLRCESRWSPNIVEIWLDESRENT